MGRRKLNRSESEIREMHRKHQRDFYERNRERLQNERMRKYWSNKNMSKMQEINSLQK